MYNIVIQYHAYIIITDIENQLVVTKRERKGKRDKLGIGA